MFCENCGKELGEDITFCAFCGTHQSATVIAASAQQVSSVTAETANSAESASISAPASVPVGAPISAPTTVPASAPVNAPINPVVPTPNVIPSSGALAYPTVTIAAPKKEKPPRERKYTLGHLILCLAAAGVMAIAAGVFAGLYFSVV